MSMVLPESWVPVIGNELEKPYFQDLETFVEVERAQYPVYPPKDEVFNALRYTPYDQVKVLLLGQDPYHGPGQAHGLCFSVKPPTPPPPSLVNIFKELREDMGVPKPSTGSLIPWAERGVLLLNAVLTVRESSPNSHKDRGWETFTDAVIRAVNAREQRVVFLLWGNYARKKKKLIDHSRHAVIESGHPSPLSQKSFLGTRPFSKVNAALEEAGLAPIDWQLP